MEKKGLCITCENDKSCTFSRKFPVWQCEEFTTEKVKDTKLKKRKSKKKELRICKDKKDKGVLSITK